MVSQRFSSILLGYSTSYVASKERLQQQQSQMEIFWFLLNPETGSSCAKFNNLFSIEIPSTLLLNIPASLYLPALPMSPKENSYLALQIASRTTLKLFYN